MARVLIEEQHTLKRNDILDAAQTLIYTRGYERMTIQDLLAALDISKGAFYHYFDSKQAVLEGLVERFLNDAAAHVTPLLEATDLTAPDKLQRFFTALIQVKVARKDLVLTLLTMWPSDANALLRDKLNKALNRQFAPMLTVIVRQGVGEGWFTTPYPEQAGPILLAIIHGMQAVLVEHYQTFQVDGDRERYISALVLAYAAFFDALERVLGAPLGCLLHPDKAAVTRWVDTLHGSS